MWLNAARLPGACADGYPPDDTGGMLVRQDMSVEESMETMNHLGQGHGLGRAWQHQLRPGCVLVVGSGGRLKQRDETQVSFAASQSAMDPHDEGQSYRVKVGTGPSSKPATAVGGVVVLNDTTWNAGTQRRWLLDHLLARCAQPKSNP